MPFKVFLRECAAKVSPKCTHSFKAKYRRTRMCTECLKHLHELKMDMKGFLKMEKNKYEEQIDWSNENSEECTITYSENRFLYNKNDLKGTSTFKTSVKTNRLELEYGLNNWNDMKKKLENDIKEREDKLKNVNKRPVLTSQQIRLRNDLDALNEAAKYEKLGPEIIDLRKQLDELNEKIELRRNSILSAPERDFTKLKNIDLQMLLKLRNIDLEVTDSNKESVINVLKTKDYKVEW